MEIPGLASKAIGFGGSSDNRIKYNGKELQSKEFSDGSGLTWEDYGARMYDPQIGRWMVSDPEADRMRRHSPYNFAFDNPMRYVDADGMVPGDFLDQQGNKIGTDGIKDGKVYVVTDQLEVAATRRSTAKGHAISASNVKSKVELPSFGNRQEMGAAVDRSNLPSSEAGDETGHYHEEGGYYGTDKDKNEIVVNAKPGKVYKVGDVGAGVNPINPADGVKSHEGENIQGTFHVHMLGDGTSKYDPKPSDTDLKNAAFRNKFSGITGNNYELSAGYEKVYIYKAINGVGKIIATLPLPTFRTYKAK